MLSLISETEINRSIIQLQGLEHGLFDQQEQLVRCSPGLSAFTIDGTLAVKPGNSLKDLFPEFVGCEEALQSVRAGARPRFVLDRVYRAQLHGRVGYAELMLVPLAEGWLLVVRDVTDLAHLEQKMTQQRNDLALLAGRLDYTRSRLDELARRFMPNQVVDAFLADGAELKVGGVRREVTILFADLRGFTPWAAVRQPEVAVVMLNILMDVVAEIVVKHGGTIDKFMGDSIMAFFNAPTDQPRHASQALACVREIAHLSGLGTDLRFGIGVNSGNVVVGNMGANRMMQYTVIGDTVNLAKRLEEQAAPGQVLCGPRFVELTEAPEQFCKNGEMHLKGYLHPIIVYRLID